MKKNVRWNRVLALCAAFALAGSTLTACVSTDDAVGTDPAAAVSASEQGASNEAQDTAAATEGVTNEAKVDNAAQASPDANAAQNLANATEPANKPEAEALENAPATAAVQPETPPAINNAVDPAVPMESPANAAPTAAASAPSAQEASSQTPTDPFAPVPAAAPNANVAEPVVPAAPAQEPSVVQNQVSAQAAHLVETIPAAPAVAQMTQPDQASDQAGAVPEKGTLVPYHVRKGDTLASISERIYGNKSRWSELAALNNLANPNLIYTGDVVLYKMDAQAKAFAAKAATHQQKTVTVAPGESLWTIASRELGMASAWRVIWKDNPSITNPDHIKVGAKLVITNWMKVAQKD